ncbi:hypothetical protein PTKIN_Ptkin05aG0094200 [Pterospermum kingtungense]
MWMQLFFHDERRTGLGMVLRDDQGRFIAARSMYLEGLLPVREGEALGSWIQDQEYAGVVLETDARRLLQGENGLAVAFVRRRANGTAHTLARAAHLYARSILWQEPPVFLSSSLNMFCTCCVS